MTSSVTLVSYSLKASTYQSIVRHLLFLIICVAWYDMQQLQSLNEPFNNAWFNMDVFSTVPNEPAVRQWSPFVFNVAAAQMYIGKLVHRIGWQSLRWQDVQ